MRLLITLLLLMQIHYVHARTEHVTLQPFGSDSLTQIRQQQAGRPFLLVLWSLDCHYCVEEISRWGALQKRYPAISVLLVNTDDPARHADVKRLLARSQPGKVAMWAFADTYAEALRWSIDPKWRGELPRYYLFDASHQATAYSGRFDPQRFSAWVKAAP